MVKRIQHGATGSTEILMYQDPVIPAKERVKKFICCSFTRFPGGSRGPLPRGTNLVLVGKTLQLLDGPGAVAGWIPAFEGVIQSRQNLKTRGHG